ncbi:sulfurtransferase complex subunit TusD [Marinomonas pollencensis]|nr:sulfurtransferase complex subunit TusD [Marinomonas pollencensis]
MQYALLVTGSPYQTKACHSALKFLKAALLNPQHTPIGVFFYEEAVLIGNALSQPPRDEFDLRKEWAELAKAHHIPLYLCIAASVRRGIVNETESKRYELSQHSLAEGFQLEGLGTLVELMNTTSKLIQFR